jgi:MerR family regulatory protein
MAKPKSGGAFRAAECARRTGLTVRALRLYERLGLIKPARSTSGWRLYGRRELVRLNAIGDPDTCARWSRAMGAIYGTEERGGLDPTGLEAWDYLLEARAAAKSP